MVQGGVRECASGAERAERALDLELGGIAVEHRSHAICGDAEHAQQPPRPIEREAPGARKPGADPDAAALDELDGDAIAAIESAERRSRGLLR